MKHPLPIADATDVAARHLCTGCGACAAALPGKIDMIDSATSGRRPRARAPLDPGEQQTSLRVCPGADARARRNAGAWGPITRVWEGWARDPDTRFRASSGGIITALCSWALTEGAFDAVLHTAARNDAPILNETVISTTPEQLLQRAGSRYAPASPCDRLHELPSRGGSHVFVGKPCDVTGAARLSEQDPAIGQRIGLRIAFFCAGTPTHAGTRALLDELGVDDPSCVTSLRYRGNGWPGSAVAEIATNTGTQRRTLSYERSWGLLAKHKQWRCHICPDHVGFDADISVGDAWETVPDGTEPGRSLVIARTPHGERAVLSAQRAGYLELHARERDAIDASQPNLARSRAQVFGRVIGMRMIGLSTPKIDAGSLALAWWSGLSVNEKARSVLGTARRALARGMRRPDPIEPPVVDPRGSRTTVRVRSVKGPETIQA